MTILILRDFLSEVEMVRYINVRSKSRIEFIDITEMVQEVIKGAGVCERGLLSLCSPYDSRHHHQ